MILADNSAATVKPILRPRVVVVKLGPDQFAIFDHLFPNENDSWFPDLHSALDPDILGSVVGLIGAAAGKGRWPRPRKRWLVRF